jgi:RNA polymerase sigma-32 factor
MGTTAAHKKLFFNLRKLKNEMKAIDDGDLLPEQVSQNAERLNVSEKEAVSMTRRMAKHDSSLNAPVREEGEGEWLDWLTDDQVSQEDQMARSEELDNRRILLAHAMEGLTERERHILVERRLKDSPATLEILSQKFGISRERVRQIEVRAFEKLQKSMRNAALEQRIG